MTATPDYLLRQRRTGGLKLGDGGGRLVDQRFNDDGCHPGTLHVERVGRTWREVDDASASVWTAVVDFDDDRAAVIEVGDLRERGQRERAMRGGGGDAVEELAAGGLFAHKVIPGSFSELTTPSLASRATTGVSDKVTNACYGRETCAPFSHPARWHFCVSRSDTDGLGCALFWRLGNRAGGCHQARERNTDRSTHWHCIVSFLLRILDATNLAVPYQSY